MINDFDQDRNTEREVGLYLYNLGRKISMRTDNNG